MTIENDKTASKLEKKLREIQKDLEDQLSQGLDDISSSR